MFESAVTTKGQTTIPKSVRASLGLRPGDRVRYIVLGREVRLVKVRSVMDLSGLLHRPGVASKSLADMEAAIAAGALGSDT